MSEKQKVTALVEFASEYCRVYRETHNGKGPFDDELDQEVADEKAFQKWLQNHQCRVAERQMLGEINLCRRCGAVRGTCR